jgi:radical SAM superfamily enzyme YgiQ (UPF0313 family)
MAYPWSLGYASSILKQSNIAEVKAIDAQGLDFNERDFISSVRKFKPDLIIADLPTISFPLMMEILEQIKEELKCLIAVSGIHVCGLPMETMNEYPFIDYVMTGEYELNVIDLVKAIQKGEEPDHVRGLLYKKNGEIKITSPSTFNVPFDSLPYPDRDDLPVTLYHDFEVAGKPTVQMLTSRGCPYQCSFCCTTVYWPGGRYWQRSPENVVNEMEFVKEKYGAKQVYFDDDIVSKQMLRGLSKEILSRGLDLPWTFMGSINLDEEILRLAHRAGAVGLKFGVESINPIVLHNINKRWIQKEKVEKFVRLCKKYDLWTHGTFIVGLPQDTKESILKTLEFAIDLDLDTAQFYIATPLPGSAFYQEAKEKGWLVIEDWTYYDGNNYSTLNYPWLSKEEIEELIKICKREWELSAFKKYMKNPRRVLRYINGRGFGYTLRKVKTLLTSRGHILTAGL